MATVLQNTWLDCESGDMSLDGDLTVLGTVYSTVDPGGTSDQFVKGDGSLDSTVYLTDTDLSTWAGSTSITTLGTVTTCAKLTANRLDIGDAAEGTETAIKLHADIPDFDRQLIEVWNSDESGSPYWQYDGARWINGRGLFLYAADNDSSGGGVGVALGDFDNAYATALGAWTGGTTALCVWGISDTAVVFGGGTSQASVLLTLVGVGTANIVEVYDPSSALAFSIDSNGTTQIKQLHLTPGSAPGSPAEGDVYYDSSAHMLKCYDGSNWKACW